MIKKEKGISYPNTANGLPDVYDEYWIANPVLIDGCEDCIAFVNVDGEFDFDDYNYFGIRPVIAILELEQNMMKIIQYGF